jgi:MFS family permease
MEAYCLFLIGNFIALPAFAQRYGIWSEKDDKWVIETKWQSALQVIGPVGAIIGVVIAGPITSRIGYRWATILGLMLLNCFIFIFYFADSLPVMLIAQLFEGIPWGIFVANSPAYCSEIVPLQLRAPATQMLQMFWAIGAIIVGGVAYHYNDLHTQQAFRYVSIFFFARYFSNRNSESLSLYSGCSPPLSPSSSSSLPSLLGGWSERVVSKRLPMPFDVSDVPPTSTMPTRLLP